MCQVIKYFTILYSSTKPWFPSPLIVPRVIYLIAGKAINNALSSMVILYTIPHSYGAYLIQISCGKINRILRLGSSPNCGTTGGKSLALAPKPCSQMMAWVGSVLPWINSIVLSECVIGSLVCWENTDGLYKRQQSTNKQHRKLSVSL